MDDLVQFSVNKAGGYFIYKIKVQRGIKGKTKSKVDELLIIGVPKKKLNDYCLQHKYIITSKALYINNDMDQPLLYRTGNNVWMKLQ